MDKRRLSQVATEYYQAGRKMDDSVGFWLVPGGYGLRACQVGNEFDMCCCQITVDMNCNYSKNGAIFT